VLGGAKLFGANRGRRGAGAYNNNNNNNNIPSGIYLPRVKKKIKKK